MASQNIWIERNKGNMKSDKLYAGFAARNWQ